VPSGSGELGAAEPPGTFPEVSGNAVERLDVVASVGEKEGLVPGVDVGRPGTDHADHRSPAVGHGMNPAVAGIPADGSGYVAVSEFTERDSFGGVVLAQVVGESPEMFGMAFSKCSERATRADGAELAVVPDDDQLCARSLDGGEEPGEVYI
jgi:hypothetical protein